ncbi:ImmA/IrrE family metallo-endopeptidase [Ectobacillus sp. JY-23]|uniref:ImmA/IrrE family metallo-endopeptidase n=1 Tax=Ectobacillus sp. JY-23 TaxID=2933872 RepID=UPI001FF5DA4D|nr:ImmA/IrrE family metallo-endopeptidase [Ectobacillus sp. JY-23]UOY92869.1 ImmA/IrrE family metallo-endopeptidase [Ectobacillus sp. JY-23]
MFLHLYFPTTPLEDWITAFYKRIGVKQPKDLNIDYIADQCNVLLLRERTESYRIDNDFIQIIVLDERLSPQKQREVFFHELCHMLRHYGNQGIMPESFRQLQEWDAVRFTKCAAIPIHMLQYIRLENNRDIIADMSEMFKVTPRLCKERLNQIRNRMAIKEYTA